MYDLTITLIFIIVVLIVIICGIIIMYEIYQKRLEYRLKEIEYYIRKLSKK